ncbi:hypothetical protein [Clostridium ganghwense]|uniref:Uncharacterized protein n=1 Tax=Clostridium ganghwense TaxID=312089 RepID=A0ABT4CS98_9CLOT|nr:hypothetical protein [Clostridium ganghwense]MCY6371930.1 hypothetical protein [Clostridium ganghwense]
MAAFFKAFLPMLLMVIIILIVYNVLKIYVLEKIKINKWIVLTIALVVLLVPSFVWPQIAKSFWYYIQTAVFLILFLWFMDLAGLSRKSTPNNGKDSMIRSKAKPSRLNKNNDMEIINKGKKKKKK